MFNLRIFIYMTATILSPLLFILPFTFAIDSLATSFSLKVVLVNGVATLTMLLHSHPASVGHCDSFLKFGGDQMVPTPCPTIQIFTAVQEAPLRPASLHYLIFSIA